MKDQEPKTLKKKKKRKEKVA